MSTDTMYAGCQSIYQDKYLQVFGNKDFFEEAYPIKTNKDNYKGLDKFVKEYGAPDKTIYDGAGEQFGRKTEFQQVMRKYEIKRHAAKPNQSNQNPVEGCIREIRCRWLHKIFWTY